MPPKRNPANEILQSMNPFASILLIVEDSDGEKYPQCDTCNKPAIRKVISLFVICDWLWEKGHIRAYFQNRVIGTAG